MKEVILAMMVWISNATGYAVPEPPALEYLSSYEIKRFAYGCDLTPVPIDFIEVCDTSGDWDVDDMEKHNIPLGLYDHERQVVMINESFEKDEAHDRSVIFHELVHHIQFHNGVYEKVKCFGELEKEAYDLQDRWLKEKYNVGVRETIGVNDLFLLLIFSCQAIDEFQPPDPEYSK